MAAWFFVTFCLWRKGRKKKGYTTCRSFCRTLLSLPTPCLPAGSPAACYFTALPAVMLAIHYHVRLTTGGGGLRKTLRLHPPLPLRFTHHIHCTFTPLLPFYYAYTFIFLPHLVGAILYLIALYRYRLRSRITRCLSLPTIMVLPVLYATTFPVPFASAFLWMRWCCAFTVDYTTTTFLPRYVTTAARLPYHTGLPLVWTETTLPPATFLLVRLQLAVFRYVHYRLLVLPAGSLTCLCRIPHRVLVVDTYLLRSGSVIWRRRLLTGLPYFVALYHTTCVALSFYTPPLLRGYPYTHTTCGLRYTCVWVLPPPILLLTHRHFPTYAAPHCCLPLQAKLRRYLHCYAFSPHHLLTRF